MATGSTKVLLVSIDPIGKRMAGPSIRVLEIAKQLSVHFDTTIFARGVSDVVAADLCSRPTFHLVTGDAAVVYELAASADVVFLQTNGLRTFPKLAELAKHLVIDLYDPYMFELLNIKDVAEKDIVYRRCLFSYETSMSQADFSVCASERQRDYWIGRYCALGRLTQELHSLDPTFRRLIDVVPFGLSAEAPQRTGPGIRGVVPGIGQDDFILLWGGGLWDWLDPLTVIRSVGNLCQKFPQVKLYFMGTVSPNPAMLPVQMVARARSLALELGVLDKHVFFGDSWVGYDERVNILLDADVAVSAHFNTAETRYSFRTRLLDALWAGLPILSTGDDSMSDLVKNGGAGEALPYGDDAAWSEAIARLLGDAKLQETYRRNVAKLALQFHWDCVVKPLIEYCHQPYKLPKHKRPQLPTLMERAKSAHQAGGYELLLKRSVRFLRKFLPH